MKRFIGFLWYLLKDHIILPALALLAIFTVMPVLWAVAGLCEMWDTYNEEIRKKGEKS